MHRAKQNSVTPKAPLTSSKLYLSLECGIYNAAIKPRAIADIRRRRKGQKVQIVSSLNNLQFMTFGVHCTLTDIAEAQQ